MVTSHYHQIVALAKTASTSKMIWRFNGVACHLFRLQRRADGAFCVICICRRVKFTNLLTADVLHSFGRGTLFCSFFVIRPLVSMFLSFESVAGGGSISDFIVHKIARRP